MFGASETYLTDGDVASLGLTAATGMQECSVKCCVSTRAGNKGVVMGTVGLCTCFLYTDQPQH